jgi:transcriptional regulator with XRE-family HTH domain
MTDPDAFYASLGRRIQDRRKARGLTQEQLGSRITPAVTRASIANIEAGKQGVLTHTLVQLASVLSTTPEELLPKEMSDEDPALRNRVQDELARKLSVPAEASRRLTEKLFAQTDERRRKHERSTRTSHR